MTTVHATTFQEIENIFSTLRAAVNHGYGPSFQHTMISSSTGKLLITNNGIQILNTLNLSHPIARYGLSCINKHKVAVGDDSKTFIILMHELIHKLNHLVEFGGQHKKDTIICITRDFNFVISEVLPRIFVHLNGLCTKYRIDEDNAPTSALLLLINGVLGSHLLENDSAHISKLLVTWIINWTGCNFATNFLITLNFLIDNHEFTIIENPGRPSTSSHLLPGLVVSRGFCNSNISVLTSTESEPLRFILMTCSIEAVDDEPTGIPVELHLPEASHQETLNKIIGYKRLSTNSFLNDVTKLGINVIFTSTNMSTLEKTQCSRYGVSVVHNIPEQEIFFISRCTGVQLLGSKNELNVSNIGTMTKCEQIVFGSNYYIKMSCENLPVSPSCLAVAGPTEGISQQIHLLILDALKSLRSACSSHPSLQGSSLEHLAASFENLSTCSSACKLSPTSEAGDSGIGLSPKSYREYQQTSLPLPPSVSPSSQTNGDLAADGDAVQLTCIPVGGAFEVALHESINNYLSTQPAGAQGTTALVILKEALLAIPQQIHNNAFYIAKPRWLSTLESLKESMRRGKLVSVDATEGTMTCAKSMHPFNSKCQLIFNVFSTLKQILNIDQII